MSRIPDGSYLSWIAPDRQSQKKGATRIRVRVIEYVIQENGKEQTYRLITDLMDISLFPALVLAQEYHSRWEAENTLDELKTHLLGRKILIRSLKPRLVVQEIYGWLLAHYCLRCLMFQAANTAEVAPIRLSFTGTLRIIRRAITKFQQATTREKPLVFDWLISEILDQIIPTRKPRSNPRVVKKTRSKFKAAKPVHRGQGTQLQQLNFIIV